MSDTSNISGLGRIQPTGSGSSKNQYQSSSGKKKKDSNPSKLHIGEIVRGTIVEKIEPKIAKVRIPTGTFLAIVAPNLLKEDTLLFKVIKTHPDLVLKVHEINTHSNGKLVNLEDLIRLLDLPKNDFYDVLIRIIAKKKKAVFKEDIIEIEKVFKFILDKLPQDVSLEQVLRLLVEMYIFELPFTEKLILKLLPLFISEDKLSYYFKELEHLSDELDPENQFIVKSIILSIKKNDEGRKNIFIIGANSSNLFNILNLEKDKKHKSHTLSIIRELRKFIIALNIWNALSVEGKTSYIYILPFYYSESFYFIQMKMNRDIHSHDEKLSFSFSVPTEDEAEVKAHITTFKKNLKIFLMSKNKELLSELQKNKESLKEALDKETFNLEAINFTSKDISDILSTKKDNKNRHFTVVV